MSNRERRRRPPPAVKVKMAFGNDDDENDKKKRNTRSTATEPNTTLPSQLIERDNRVMNPGKSYERALFTIHNITVEITLQNDTLSWSTVSDSREELSRRSSAHRDTTNSVKFHDVYAISPIYASESWSVNAETLAGMNVSTSNSISVPLMPYSTVPQGLTLRGFQLHSYQPSQDNTLQEILIIFQSNDPNQIERWYQLLSKTVLEYNPSRHIVVVLNPFAGARQTRHVYSSKIKPMLERAKYRITYIEIDDHSTADEALENFESDFDSINGLVIVGGDGSVVNVINALIRYLTRENRMRLDMDHDLPPMPFPICIVPEGTTNIISHTIHGNTDHCTPILHLLFNKQMKIDMSAVFDDNFNFVTANFSAGAGYSANVLKYFPRYNLHSTKTIIKKSFSKATSSKNLKPIEMEIRYIPAFQDNGSRTRCQRDCASCTPSAEDKSDDQVKTFDNSHVQRLNRRTRSTSSVKEQRNRSSSVGKSGNQHVEKEKNWKTFEGEYLQAAVFTNANLWSFAPQVLVEPVSRKDFLRFIKRHGSSKDQYELPFTKLIKVKEIEIELKSSIDKAFNEMICADNQIDSSLSEDSSNENLSDNEDKPRRSLKIEPRPPSGPISEDIRRHRRRHHRISEQTPETVHVHDTLQTSGSMDAIARNDSFGSTLSLRRGGTFQSPKSKRDKAPLPRPSSARGQDMDVERQRKKKNHKASKGTLRPARSLLNVLPSGSSFSEKPDQASSTFSRGSFSSGIQRRPSVISRSSSVDNSKMPNTADALRHKKRPCLWNLDFSPHDSALIRIKCFYRYLPVYGRGLDPQMKPTELHYSCFGRLG